MTDPINPKHYKQHPSGVECIEIAKHFDYCLGNVIKYVWRAGLKGDAIEDLEKARWYIEKRLEVLHEEVRLRSSAGLGESASEAGRGEGTGDPEATQ